MKNKGVIFMAFGSVSLEKRIKNNVKNYSLGQLLDLPIVQKELEVLNSQFILHIILMMNIK